MASVFDTVQLGPFAAEYHRALADSRLRAALSEFLEAVILPQVAVPFDAAQGKLSAKFDHPRHAGPNSAVRNLFELELSLIRAGGADTAKAVLRYDPASNTFSR